MRNQSIIIKLFMILTICFMMFVGSALYFQSNYFQKYYQEVKMKDLQVATDKFIELYKYTNWSIDELRVKVKVFEQTNQVKIGIIDKDGKMINEDIYSLLVRDYSNKIITVRLNSLLSESDYLAKKLKLGAEISSEGYFSVEDKKQFSPIKIYVNNQQWVDYSSKFVYSTRNNYTDKIQGTLIGYSLPKAEDLINGIDKRDLWGALELYNSQSQEIDEKNGEVLKNKSYSFVFNSSILGQKNTVLVIPFTKNNNPYKVVILHSHENLLEAMNILEDYYVYVIGAAFLLVVVISVIFSVLISKPLLQINEYAKKMANLEFDTTIPVTSNDEIGSLSTSLNTMQHNLVTSISELKVANEKLMEDIEKERQLETMRKEFISGVSHELKTPLGIIKGYSEGIRDGLARNRLDKYIGIILEEVDKMDILVNDMLDLTRLTQGQKKLEKAMFGFNELVFEVIEIFTSQLKDKNLKVEVDANGLYFEAFGDKRRIEQVIKNLLSNAVRYSYPSSTIQIELSKYKNDMVMFSIINESEAIPDEKLNKIWDKFYRVEESRNKLIAGTGLGLSIVKNILELHGSEFGVINTEKGVKFYFTMAIVGQSH